MDLGDWYPCVLRERSTWVRSPGEESNQWFHRYGHMFICHTSRLLSASAHMPAHVEKLVLLHVDTRAHMRLTVRGCVCLRRASLYPLIARQTGALTRPTGVFAGCSLSSGSDCFPPTSFALHLDTVTSSCGKRLLGHDFSSLLNALQGTI